MMTKNGSGNQKYFFCGGLVLASCFSNVFNKNNNNKPAMNVTVRKEL